MPIYTATIREELIFEREVEVEAENEEQAYDLIDSHVRNSDDGFTFAWSDCWDCDGGGVEIEDIKEKITASHTIAKEPEIAAL